MLVGVHNATACIHRFKDKWLPKTFCGSVVQSKVGLNQSPDIGPTGSVGKKQDRSFILGQTSHYPKDYTFNAFQNVSSGKRRDSNTDYELQRW